MDTERRFVEMAMAHNEKVDRALDEVLQRITAIETVANLHGTLCPYREDIARASNNVIRMKTLEEKVAGLITTVAVNGTKWGIVGAVIGGVPATILTAVVMGILGYL